jgi:hypothetical protein
VRWVRLGLFAALAITGFWLLSQITVSTWLAQQAHGRAQVWAQGQAPSHWDFSRAASVVAAGSGGLERAAYSDQGLSVRSNEEGVLNLSLALNDEIIPMAVIDQIELDFDSDAPVRVALLSVRPHRTWVTAELAGGKHHSRLTVSGLARTQTDNLLLRFESTPGTHLQLRSLALRNSGCETPGACALPVTETAFQITPERLLALRDATQQSDPVSAIVAGGNIGALAQWMATHLDGYGRHLQWAIALVLLGWSILGLRRRAGATPEHLTMRTGLDLALPIGCAVILLLTGWPARETPWPVIALFALCLVALFVTPRAPTLDWHLLGDAGAWRRAMGFSVIAVAVTAPLLGFSSPSADRDAFSLLRYPVWAIAQQWLLIAAIVPRARQLTANPCRAAFLSGLVFALLHAPNFALMVFTLLAGSVWAWLAQRDRALLPLAVSHALLGLWLIHVVPSWLLRSAEIGGRYLMPP